MVLIETSEKRWRVMKMDISLMVKEKHLYQRHNTREKNNIVPEKKDREMVVGKIDEEKKMMRVMVAIDDSECSHYALKWVLENLSDTISKSQFYIFTAQPADCSYLYPSTLGAAPHPNPRISGAEGLIATRAENKRKLAMALLEKASEMCAKHGIFAGTITGAGDPKEAICEAVEKHNIQLLVVGSHGRGILRRAFMGSISNYCVNNAKCPVFVVRKPV